jgi:hypothetical protein
MRTLAICLLVIGCTSENQMVVTAEQQFLGTWSFQSGNNNVVCPNGTTAQKLTGNVTVKTAVSGGLVVLDAQGCNFTYSVEGMRATLGDDKTCSFAVPELGQGVTADVTYDEITLSTSDGKSMSDLFSGTVRYTASTGTLTCAFSGSATLSKVSGD